MKNVKMEYEQIKKLFPHGKKGFNDISIIAIIVSILFTASLIIPFVNAEFGTTGDVFDTDNLQNEVQQDAENASTISAFTVLVTMFKLAFFDFGDTLNLPFWLDGFFSVLSIILILVIGRNIWIGGGG